MRLLFVCSRNRLRSPTAERVFHGLAGVEAQSAGVAPDAEEPLTGEMIEWAEIVFVMEASHRARMTRAFGRQLRGKRVVVLGIPDDFAFMDAELVRLLWERVPRSVPALAVARPQ